MRLKQRLKRLEQSQPAPTDWKETGNWVLEQLREKHEFEALADIAEQRAPDGSLDVRALKDSTLEVIVNLRNNPRPNSGATDKPDLSTTER